MASRTNIYRGVAAALNPVVFAESLGIEPDPWQKTVLNSRSKRILLNCSRQSGKSTITAIIALRHALYTPNALVLVVSHTLRQAKETFRKIDRFYQQLGGQVPATAETVDRLELANKSRIVSLSGQHPNSLRGFSSPTLLVIDEAAQVRDETYDEALRPMLAASNGGIVLLSTPHGKRGFFYRAWEDKSTWPTIKINARECPRTSREFLKEEKKSKPEWLFKQEYFNFFAEVVSSVFRREDIDAAFNHPELPVRDIDLELD
ncbi:MAG: terminase large subunit [Halobacteriota archaeon]|jgi:phage terminase large subunit